MRRGNLPKAQTWFIFHENYIMQQHIGLIVYCEKQDIPLSNTNNEILRWWEALGRFGRRLALKRFFPNHDGTNLTWDQLKEMYNQTISLCSQRS